MTVSKIQIICTSPGMRRNGITHPASAFYDIDRWSENEIAAFRKDPNFLVREILEGESATTEADFETRVAAEVEAKMQAKRDELALQFNAAVEAASAEKLAELQAKIEDLEAKLAAATKTTAKK